ncbi:hypothetical protein LIER_24843 [Lithospermum erythrorhizon]|uniref:Uncharacterized protein n=1 Tax=Lithospermum erythrorhizon TaxID=34254 RepID=A0AAV3R445_LITER
MCTDFTILNKACPKDFYPLPCLGRLVDDSARHEVMPFRQKNAGATYQQMAKGKAIKGKSREVFISERGIKPNPDKIHALLMLRPPNS